MITQEKMKQEAIERMEALKLSKACIDSFKTRGHIWTSEGPGLLYDDEEIAAAAAQIEQQYGGVVYHIVHSMTDFGELYSMLWVSKYDEEWDRDREDLEDGYVFSWVENLDTPWCSEFGTIGVRSINGGLQRIS